MQMKDSASRFVPDAQREETRPNDNGAAPAVHLIAMTDLDARAGHAPESHAGGRPLPLVQQLGDVPGPLRQIKARLTVCVGNVELTLGELMAARTQQVLRLDQTVDQPVDVLLEGHVVARGTLVAAEEHFAVRITELPPVGAAGERHG